MDQVLWDLPFSRYYIDDILVSKGAPGASGAGLEAAAGVRTEGPPWRVCLWSGVHRLPRAPHLSGESVTAAGQAGSSWIHLAHDGVEI